MKFGGKDEDNFVIFCLKNSRKEVARVDGDTVLGRAEGTLRESSEFRVDHSFFG